VFDIHNTLGRFCDERIYQDELAERCRGSGLDAQREVMLRAIHKDFVKPYYLDILIEAGIIYELKAVEQLNTTHQKQAINYLLLANLSHGKLVNFRAGSVESRFVSTRLRRHDRMKFQLIEDEWQGDDNASRQLHEVFTRLLEDWGVFLDMNLYREALLHFLAGSEAGIRPVEIRVNGRLAGTQNLSLLDAKTAWHLSALRTHFESYETHITRLLRHTALERIQWINFNQRNITLKTLRKK
jgi:GxxExxY protein